MARVSPTLEGFRAALRWPSVTLAEIAWRWTVGTTACALLAFAFVEFMRTLPVSEREQLLLRTRHPVLVGQAVARILEGSLSRVVATGLLGAVALTGLWIVAASIGRWATVRALLQYFAERRDPIVKSTGNYDPERSRSATTLLGLNFLRAGVVLAAIFGFAGAAILAGFASSAANPRPGLAFMLFLPMAAAVGVISGALNWFLSVAGIFAVRDRLNTLDALSTAVTFFRQHIGAVLAVSTWTGLAHLAVFIGATTIISVQLAFIQVAPARLVIIVMIAMTMAYFAIADWLYVARLAGYVCISEMPEELLALPRAWPPPQLAAPPVQTSIDRDETILSDAP